MVSVSDPVKAAGFTSIFVGVPKTVTVDQLQVILGVEAKIGRRHKNRKFVKVFVPDDDVGRVLKLDLSVSGHKLRVEKWRSYKAPSYRTNRQKGRQAVKLEDVAATVKERARFVAEFFAQSRPEGRRLYSQVASNTSEARMKSMKTAIYDVRQLLKCLSKRAS